MGSRAAEHLGIRVPPHSLEAERQVVGAMLVSTAATELLDRIHPGDLYRRDHQLILQAVADLTRERQPVDVVTVCEWLTESGDLEAAGGLEYLGSLAADAVVTANLPAYAAIVRDHATRRRLLAAAQKIVDAAYSADGQSVADLVALARREVAQVEDAAATPGGFVAIAAAVRDALTRIEEAHEHGGPLLGTPTGFADLDSLTLGLHPGELTVIAARPAMGKTSFAMNIAQNVATRSGGPVAVFSLEMPTDALTQRLLAATASLELQRVRTGALNEPEFQRLTAASARVAAAPLHLDDAADLTPTDLAARARRLSREVGPLGLVVVDYLQLMRSPEDRENRNVEIGAISRSLKALAKDLSCPVIALSQLNRGVEQRPNKRPVMSDLRDSGSIEQDADVVLMIYRDEVYNEDSPDKGIAEIIIGKHRNGPTGRVCLAFRADIVRFGNLARGGYGNRGSAGWEP